MVAIVTAVSGLLLVFANAWAKRIGGKEKGESGLEAPDDSTLNELARTVRLTGDMLHGETQALARRHHVEMCARMDEIDRRFDVFERRHREEWAELREFLRPPPGLGPLLDRLK